jgi:hypothetical protein
MSEDSSSVLDVFLNNVHLCFKGKSANSTVEVMTFYIPDQIGVRCIKANGNFFMTRGDAANALLVQAISIGDEYLISSECRVIIEKAVDAVLKADKKIVKEWRSIGMKKVVLKVKTTEELLELFEKALE